MLPWEVEGGVPHTLSSLQMTSSIHALGLRRRQTCVEGQRGFLIPPPSPPLRHCPCFLGRWQTNWERAGGGGGRLPTLSPLSWEAGNRLEVGLGWQKGL